MTERSDEELMLAFKEDEATAFNILYGRYKDALYRYFLRQIKNESICQELFQDLWMKVIYSKSNYQVKATFKTWLYTLAHNRLVDWYRRNNLEQKAFQENTEDEVDGIINWNPEDELQTKRLSKEIKQSVGKLPFSQREVFLLHNDALLTLPQIAEMLGEGLEKIKSRYRYALGRLRKDLEKM